MYAWEVSRFNADSTRAKDAESGELGGRQAWRAEDCGTLNESGTGQFGHNIGEYDVHGDKNLPDIWQAVESATSADIVTTIRRNRMRMLEEELVRRGDCDGNPITKVAMWRNRRKPEQQGAK